MPPFFDILQIEDAIQREALPALERFAANPILRRFDREEPPPYVSSESEDDLPFYPGHPSIPHHRPTQHQEAFAAEWHPRPDQDDHHPVTRAVRLRKGIRCGEHVPPRPAVHLGEDATASQAESFIMSRPWFMYSVEVGERAAKLRGIDFFDKRRHHGPRAKQVSEWWEERGDWRKDWCEIGTKRPGLGWKWRHESPSPEPEDLTRLNILDNMEGMDVTPSEVDALEAIRPPTPPAWLTDPDGPLSNKGRPVNLFGTADTIYGDGSITLFGGPGRVVFDDVSEASHGEPPQLRRSSRIRASIANKKPSMLPSQSGPKRPAPRASAAVRQSRALASSAPPAPGPAPGPAPARPAKRRSTAGQAPPAKRRRARRGRRKKSEGRG
ncbi:hypothetical protein QQZ08_004193 [Neonectria magnoliae]|uniref:Uncharacterized protein n=1 Tax=Neonectria magnoliae TaxID=2732573 RepID=A0ABR1I8Q5_9HYPO